MMSWLTDLLKHRIVVPGAIEASVVNGGPIAHGEESTRVRLVQSRLIYAGHSLVDDGEFGDITQTAIEVFQAARHLPTLGYVDRGTAAALDAVPAPAAPIIHLPSVLKQAPWVSDVRACTGTKEVPGSANSPIIMEWRADIGRAFPEMKTYAYTYSGDDIPWCGFGMGGAMCRQKIRPPFGARGEQKFMWADSWHAPNWGTRLDRPMTGCIMTFTRNGGGHVGMLEKIEGKKIWVRGYNQSDDVTVAVRTLDSTFTAATWPPGYAVVDIPGLITNTVERGSEQ